MAIKDEICKYHTLHCDKCGKVLKNLSTHIGLVHEGLEDHIPVCKSTSVDILNKIAIDNGWTILPDKCLCPDCCSGMTEDGLTEYYYQLTLKK